jgi:hypothetical protein
MTVCKPKTPTIHPRKSKASCSTRSCRSSMDTDVFPRPLCMCTDTPVTYILHTREAGSLLLLPTFLPRSTTSLLHLSIPSTYFPSISITSYYCRPEIHHAFRQKRQSTTSSSQAHHFSKSAPYSLCINSSTPSNTTFNSRTISKFLHMARSEKGPHHQEKSHHCDSWFQRRDYSRCKRRRCVLDGRRHRD